MKMTILKLLSAALGIGFVFINVPVALASDAVNNIETYPHTDLTTSTATVQTDPSWHSTTSLLSTSDFNGLTDMPDARSESGNEYVYSSDQLPLTFSPSFVQYFSKNDHSSAALVDDCEYSIEMTGPSVNKKLIKTAYEKSTYVKNDISEDGYTGEIAYGTLMYFNRLMDRLGLPDGAQSPSMTCEMPYYIYSKYGNNLDELKKYSSASDFLQNGGYGTYGSNEKYTYDLGDEDFIQDSQVFRDCGSDYIKFAEKMQKDNHAAGYYIQPCIKYKTYIVVNADAIEDDSWIASYQKDTGRTPEKRNGYYYISGFQFNENADLASIKSSVSNLADTYAERYNFPYSEVTYRIDKVTENKYGLYYNFSRKQFADAWAAEMDSWSGHWDFFLYGDEHFDYCLTGNFPAGINDIFHTGNIGSFITAQRLRKYPARYAYTVTKPGTYWITVKGKDYYSDSCNFKVTVLSPEETKVNNAANLLISKTKKDSDPAHSKFRTLKVRSPKQTKSSISIKWHRIKGADKYVLFGNQCGKKYRILKTASKNKLRINKVAGKSIKKGKYYKFFVAAFDNNGKLIAASKTIHVSSKGGKVGNFKHIQVRNVKNNIKVLQKGKSFLLKTKSIRQSRKLKVKIHRSTRFESSNTEIASVNRHGKIKAEKKGTCTIYAYAQNGIFTKIRVSVK